MNKKLRADIRMYYKILDVEDKNEEDMWNPYDVLTIDFKSLMSPLEWMVFRDITSMECPVKYSQYPVDGYFLDFADPIKKICIEVDSNEWHSTDEQIKSDWNRQKELEEFGWIVYRINSDEARSTEKTRSILKAIIEKHYENDKDDVR